MRLEGVQVLPIVCEGLQQQHGNPRGKVEQGAGVIVGTLPPVVVHQEAFAKLVDYQDILMSNLSVLATCVWLTVH